MKIEETPLWIDISLKVFAFLLSAYGIFVLYRIGFMLFFFKKGHNIFERICRKCGSHQNMYMSNIEGEKEQVWWEDVYPIGNNEKCKCHSYSHPRNYI